MRRSRLLMEFEAIAEKLGVQVVREKLLGSRGGLCRVYDQHLLFLERNLTEGEQVEVFVTALSRFPLGDIQMLPRVRDLLTRSHDGKQQEVSQGTVNEH
ncbi:MAG: hypothetical protein JRJ12_14835 [Deltaproteobacteria bacterium]|nr:hypothetical protein [Deltaproteobacteria bacterium]MBW2072576.1 hypothetical protein [Deltaproteobacteria bacterium]